MKAYSSGSMSGFVLLAVTGLLALASPPPAHAAPALVEDISPTDAFPDLLVDLDGLLIFVADDDTNGVELWRSDGTAAGTSLVADINPSGDSDPGANTGLVVFNGAVWFDADDGTAGTELWKSDGTGAGTVLVEDVRPGPNDSDPSSLVASDGTLFFSANDGSNGEELWKVSSSGTAAELVNDINAGGNSNPHDLADVNGTLYFGANDGTSGDELWQSDGTVTIQVSDINPIGSSNPANLVDLNGTLIFTATDGTTGTELWKSDVSGTSLVKDIRAAASSSPGDEAGMINLNGTLFFDANDGTSGRELWKSDGTTAGTVLLKDINSGGGSSSPGQGVGRLIAVNGTLFFDADDGVHGTELWKSDGTETGTVIVKDIYAGSLASEPSAIAHVFGTVFLNANDGVNGRELWQSDGSDAGTTLVANIAPALADADPQSLTNVAGMLFFSADDGTTGVELWNLFVCESIDPLLPGCVPATSDLAKCGASLGKLTLKLLASDRKCASKNNKAALKSDAYAGQACEDLARYRFLSAISSIQVKDPGCVPTCFGSGNPDSRALEIESAIDVLNGAIYCDATSAVAQDDGFGGFLPTETTEDCSAGMAKLAGSLAKSLIGCNTKQVSALITASDFDLAECQTTATDRFDDGVTRLSDCPACLQPTAIRDAVVRQSNASDSASAYCRNELP